MEKEKIYEVLKEYIKNTKDIKICYVFGSFLNNEKANDIDIAFLLSSDEQMNRFYKEVEISTQLSLLTGIDNMDIVILNEAPVIFKYEIIQNGLCIFSEDEEITRAFEELSFKEYYDFLHRICYYDTYMFNRIREEGSKMDGYNKDLVSQRSNMCEGTLNQLLSLSKLDKTKFTEDPHNLALAEHYLRICIDTLIDLSNHIIAVKGLGRPRSIKDMIDKLKDNNIIPAEFSNSCAKFIKLRDRLVHFYWEIEADEIYQVLEKELPKLKDFLKYLLTFIEKG